MYRSTLLFSSQYNNFRGIFDYSTKNKSFLKMSYILKKLGVKNRFFFLYLSQPELKGIDPYYEDLDHDTKVKIGIECRINPWYYFREVVRIPSTGSIRGSRFYLDRANLAMIWCFLNEIGVFLTIPRQKGKTVSTQALQSYILFIRGNNLISSMFTKDNDLCTDNVEKLRKIRDGLPLYLVRKSPFEKDNTRVIEYKPLRNKYTSYVAQSTEIGAEKIGRGSTVPVVHFDEIVLFNNIHITFPSCMNAMSRAIKDARNLGQPRGILITSTAGNLDVPPGKFGYSLISESTRFDDKLYDSENHDELMNRIYKSSLAGRVYIEYSFLQLGGSKDELREAVARSKTEGSDQLQILRDLFNIWTRGSSKSPFSGKILEKLKEAEVSPKYIEYVDSYTFRWYENEDRIKGSWFKNTPIIMGVDPSENVGNDYTSMCFINALDGGIIGTMRCNESNVIKIAILIYKFLVDFPNILSIIERNSTGCVIIDKIVSDLIDDGINPLERLFNLIVQEGQESIHSFGLENIRNSGNIRKKIGFRTTNSKKTGRTFLFKVVLMKFLNDFIDKIRDSIIINEICGIRDKNGRLDHEDGSHDDSLFSLMLGGYALFFGKHMREYSFLKHTKKEILEESYISFKEGVDLKEKKYKQIQSEIIDIKKRLNRKMSPILRVKLEKKLNNLNKQIPDKYKVMIEKEDHLRIDRIKEKIHSDDSMTSIVKLTW